jgi:hypothetical protein
VLHHFSHTSSREYFYRHIITVRFYVDINIIILKSMSPNTLTLCYLCTEATCGHFTAPPNQALKFLDYVNHFPCLHSVTPEQHSSVNFKWNNTIFTSVIWSFFPICMFWDSLILKCIKHFRCCTVTILYLLLLIDICLSFFSIKVMLSQDVIAGIKFIFLPVKQTNNKHTICKPQFSRHWKLDNEEELYPKKKRPGEF